MVIEDPDRALPHFISLREFTAEAQSTQRGLRWAQPAAPALGALLDRRLCGA